MENVTTVLAEIVAGHRLSSEEARAVMSEVFAGNVPPAQIAGLLTVLRSRRESVEELTGFSTAMLHSAAPLAFDEQLRVRLVDTCGTGGDRSGSINVSTIAALVVASAGVPVCKHGNRASSSQTGSADLLEALGVDIEIDPSDVVRCVEQAGIGFCFAPKFHPAMKHVGPVRRELGIATVFNFLGPLVNPARVTRQVVGVSDPEVAEIVIEVLQVMGATRAMVVHGHDGLDELTTTTTSTIYELRNGERRKYDFDPASIGVEYANPSDLKGGGPTENADHARQILAGKAGARSDLVALNAAAALMVGEAVESLSEGFDLARSLLSDRSAERTLERFVGATRQPVA